VAYVSTFVPVISTKRQWSCKQSNCQHDEVEYQECLRESFELGDLLQVFLLCDSQEEDAHGDANYESTHMAVYVNSSR
jgi:hypothetical protein